MVPWRGSLIKWLPWCPLTVLHHCHRRHYLSVWILDSRQVPRLTLRSLPRSWFGNLTNIPPRSCYHLFWGEGGMAPSCGSIAPCFFWGRCDGALVFEGWCDGFLKAVRCFLRVMVFWEMVWCFLRGVAMGPHQQIDCRPQGLTLGLFSLVRSQVSD